MSGVFGVRKRGYDRVPGTDDDAAASKEGASGARTAMLVGGMIVILAILGIAIAALVLSIQNRHHHGIPPTPASAYPVCTVRNVRATGRARDSVQKECLRLSYDYRTNAIPNRRHHEDECYIAINPVNPKNMIVTSHQGSFESWNADAIWFTKDGGETWHESHITTTRCQNPTTIGSEQDYVVASDPVVAFTADGVAFYSGNNFNIGTDSDPLLEWKEGMPLFKSIDGGANWEFAEDVNKDDGIFHYNDRVIIDTHPTNKSIIVQSWADFPCYSIAGTCGDESLRIRVSEDGGNTWQGSQDGVVVYYDRDVPNANTFDFPLSWYSRVFFMPNDGPWVLIAGQSDDSVDNAEQRVLSKSFDNGRTWSAPVTISATGGAMNTFFPRPLLPLANTQFLLPSATTRRFMRAYTINYAMNKHTGYLYGVGTSPIFATGQAVVNTVVHMSKDGGDTWTTPVLVDPEHPERQSFLAAIAVADDGTVGVHFYDDRNNNFSDPSRYMLDMWLVLFDKDLNRLGETRITENSFDYMASNAGTTDPIGVFNPFLGDYTQMQADRNEFVGVYAAVEQEWTGVPSLKNNATYFVDEEDRQNLYVYRASANCGFTPSSVTFARNLKMTEQKRKQQRHVPRQKRTMTNLDYACHVVGHRRGGNKANELATPRYLQKFNVTMEQVHAALAHKKTVARK